MYNHDFILGDRHSSIPLLVIPSINWHIALGKYITSSTNPCMVGSIDDARYFEPYLWNLYQCRHPLDLKDGILKKPSLVVSVTLWTCVWLRMKN